PSEQLDRTRPVEAPQVELHELRVPREVGDHQDVLVPERAHEGQHLAVVRVQQLDRPAAERLVRAPLRDQALRPPQQRAGIGLLPRLIRARTSRLYVRYM